MARLATFVLIGYICHTALGALPQAVLQPALIDHKLRPLQDDDLDDLTTVFLDAFRPSASWQYTHWDDDKYANYTWQCSRAEFGQFWQQRTGDFFVNAITVPIHGSGEREERVVSIGVWEWLNADTHLSRHYDWISSLMTGPDCAAHLDQNTTRRADLMRQAKPIEAEYIRSWTEPQLYLVLLATHPDWDGNGFGAEQLDAGFRAAERWNVSVSLIATPAGYPLYESSGFAALKNITLHKLDGLGELWLEYMRWHSPQNL
jgi:GNAT superfamily N-acetyltransferase